MLQSDGGRKLQRWKFRQRHYGRPDTLLGQGGEQLLYQVERIQDFFKS